MYHASQCTSSDVRFLVLCKKHLRNWILTVLRQVSAPSRRAIHLIVRTCINICVVERGFPLTYIRQHTLMRRRPLPLPNVSGAVDAVVPPDGGSPQGLDLTLGDPAEDHSILSPPPGHVQFVPLADFIISSPTANHPAVELARLTRMGPHRNDGASEYNHHYHLIPLTPRFAGLARKRHRASLSDPTEGHAQTYDTSVAPLSKQHSLDSAARLPTPPNSPLAEVSSPQLWITPIRKRQIRDRTKQMVPTRARSEEIREDDRSSLIFPDLREGNAQASILMYETPLEPPSVQRSGTTREGVSSTTRTKDGEKRRRVE